MKKILLALSLFCLSLGQTTKSQFRFYGFEHVAEANGLVVIGKPGDPYKTSISLASGAQVHNGDSALVCFVTGAHGSTDCNDPVDSCQRHRCYVNIPEYTQINGDTDTTHLTGAPLPSPIWIQVWYRYENMTLTGTQWESQLTACGDPTNNCFQPITTGRNAQNYLYIEHAPKFDSTAWTYQLDSIKDPAGKYRVTPGKWHLLQWYVDNDSIKGFSMLWVDGVLHSKANIRGGSSHRGYVSYAHAGMYCSPSVAHGTVYNDDFLMGHVNDTAEGMQRFMATPAIRGPP